GEVRLRGWVEGAGRRAVDVVHDAMAAGAVAVIVTDIARDGRMTGPDVVGLAGLLEVTGAPLIASGGVASLDDLRLLAAVRGDGRTLSGVVVGKALYEASFTVAEAVAACQALGPSGQPLP
ncbi:MAG: hypothetical protein J2P57_21975, partial [Acidimicrobiaceae bacterium]|nr:hypothetical protein [Acidimicrobiaceae bacterium]